MIKRVNVNKPILGTQIDWSDPLSQGLVGCWLFNEGGGSKASDLVAGRNMTGVNSPILSAAGITTNGTNNYSLYDGTVPESISTGKHTIFLVCKATTASQSDQTIFALGASTGFMRVDHTGTKYRLHVRNTNDADWFNYDSTAVVSATQYQSVCMSFDCSVIGGTASTYVNGVDATTSSQTRGGNTGAAITATKICVGALYRTSAAAYWAGTVKAALYYNRRLGSSEIRQLHELTAGW